MCAHLETAPPKKAEIQNDRPPKNPVIGLILPSGSQPVFSQ